MSLNPSSEEEAQSAIHSSLSLTSKAAPWYSVPPRCVTNVEHPFVVKDVSKAIQSLGGAAMVEKLVVSTMRTVEAELFLRPLDPMAHSITSGIIRTENLLLLITVPKRTGRKRKRGSLEPYRDFGKPVRPIDSEALSASISRIISRNAKLLLKSLEDNPQRYEIQPIGRISESHRFRNMPDYVYSTTETAFMQKLRDHILPFDYEKAKLFRFDHSKGVQQNTELIPPPSFTHFSTPFNYSYHQNPAVKQRLDSSGNIATINDSAAPKVLNQRVVFDAPSVPTEPSTELLPFDMLDFRSQNLVTQLKACLERRPIWTRRALGNAIQNPDLTNNGKQIYQYVGYMFSSGPWRDAVVKYGVDPRRDPKYRVYQTMMFQLDLEGRVIRDQGKGKTRGGERIYGWSRFGHSPLGNQSHIFDGINVGLDGKVWQVCDITDPDIQVMLATTILRPQCHLRTDGWYHNGTWAKARAITKAKMAHIYSESVPLEAYQFARVLDIPGNLNLKNRHLATFDKSHADPKEVALATQVRALASTPEPESIVSTRDGAECSPSEIRDAKIDDLVRKCPFDLGLHDSRAEDVLLELEIATGRRWNTTQDEGMRVEEDVMGEMGNEIEVQGFDSSDEDDQITDHDEDIDEGGNADYDEDG